MLSKRKECLPVAAIERHRQKRGSMRFLHSSAFAALRRLSFFILVGGILIGFTYTALFSDFFTVSKITLEKNGNAVSGTELAPFLDKLKGKNILFVNTESLKKEIEQTFKNQVLLVNTKKSYPHRIIVKVEEYPAILNLHAVAGEKTQKFVVNQIGYAILENADQKDLPVLVWRTDKPISRKSVIIEPAKLNPIAEAYSKFTAMFGIKISAGEWHKIERELHLKTEKNFYLWIDLTADIDQQLAKLKHSLPKLDIYNEPLEYIDLRISGGENEKVIYKRK